MRKDGEPYMPSNATEFDCFYSRWCHKCANDDPDVGDNCEIIGNAMFCEQPTEWTYRQGQAHCSAFVPFEAGSHPKPEPRCPHTLELFP